MISQKERNARNAFKTEAMGRINVELIENQLSEGTPDAVCINRNGITFWLEFKALDAWPKRDSTLPLKGEFKRGQIPFMKQWISWRGLSFVLLKAEAEYYLLNPKGTQELPEETKAEVIKHSLCVGLKQIVKYLEELR